MPSNIPASRAFSLLAALTIFGAVSNEADAQNGKWVATIPQFNSVTGSAELTIDSRNDKQSRAKLSLRNLSRDKRVAWDIVAGRCRDEGVPIAPQASFQQVQTQMDGSGSASANIPKLEPGKLYYVRVFDPQVPATDASAWGCANISEKP